MAQDHIVVSADETPIASGRSGSGPPILLVHGAIGDRTSFRLVEPMLAERFTVVAVDRRGHGGSGDSSSPYAIEQEFADIAAVADSLSEPVDVLGHSYGATVALGAALLTPNIRRLILYEPSPGIQAVDAAFIARLDDLVARNEREAVLEIALTEFAGFGAEDLEAYRQTPLWAPRVAAAHTIPREIRAEISYAPGPEAFAAMTAPVLFLLGSESPEWARRSAETIRSLVRDTTVAILGGQGHMATVSAPGLLVDEVQRFVSG